MQVVNMREVQDKEVVDKQVSLAPHLGRTWKGFSIATLFPIVLAVVIGLILR